MKIRTFLGSSDKIFFNLMLFSSVKPSLGLVINLTRSVTLTPNLIFLFFWSRPLDFKSSFKLRKGHFPTVQFYEKLPSPTESHSPGVKQSHARTSGPIEKSFWTLALVDLITTNLKMHSPEKVASPCTRVIFQKERAIWTGLRFDHQKSAQWKQTIMSTRIQITRYFKEMECQYSIPFWTPHYKRTIIKNKKGLREKKKK
jgi:hypothetical protein